MDVALGLFPTKVMTHWLSYAFCVFCAERENK